MFDDIDTNDDRRISITEFKAGVPKMKEYGVNIGDPQAEFNKIDVNGGGMILFDEFCAYAIRKNLELNDDDED